MTCSFSPVSRRTAAWNSGPSVASRVAAVATTVKGDMAIPLANRENRFSAAKARVLPSGFSMPVSARPLPRPHMIFSL